jgi:hypothetical protein
LVRFLFGTEVLRIRRQNNARHPTYGITEKWRVLERQINWPPLSTNFIRVASSNGDEIIGAQSLKIESKPYGREKNFGTGMVRKELQKLKSGEYGIICIAKTVCVVYKLR